MPPRKSKRLCLTLFTTLVLAVAFAQASEVHSPLQRDHVLHGRFVRKRAPSPQDGPGAVLLPPVGGAAPSPSLPSEETTTAAEASVDPNLSSGALATPSTIDIPLGVTSSSDSSTTSESSTSSSIVSQTTESVTTTSAPATAIEQAKVTLTSEVDAPAETSAVPPPKGSALAKKNTALTVIIVVAASIGGVAIIWTIFRKWKLGRSNKKFDKRLQPVDWQPPERDEDIVPGVHRMNGSSVHGHGSSNHGHGDSVGPLPDHDFTAVAAVGGYADLARGPAYNPQMQESAHHGPSFGRYDV